MQASLKLNTKNSQYMTITISNSQEIENTPTKMPKFNRDELNDSHSTHTKMIEPALDFPLVDSVLEQSAIIGPNQQKQCKQCSEWKRWAALQQQALLAIETQLIDKQTSMRNLVGKLHMEIANKDRLIEEYRIRLEAIESQRTSLEKEIQEIRSYSHKDKGGVDQETFMTPIKSKQTEFCMQIQLESLSKESKREFVMDRKDVGKASTIGGKTDGWMTTNSKIMKETVDGRCPSVHKRQLGDQKILFQNQILKEYNATLLQRLKATHIKKYF